MIPLESLGYLRLLKLPDTGMGGTNLDGSRVWS